MSIVVVDFFFAYCLLHAAFSPSRGMVKSQGHSDKGFNMQTKRYNATHKWRLVKNHLHLISGMILNRNQSLLMRI